MEETSQGELLLYQDEKGATQIEVRLENENVWLTQAQLVTLYQSSKANISEHIKHIFEEGELEEKAVVRKFRTTAADGKNYNTAYYNFEEGELEKKATVRKFRTVQKEGNRNVTRAPHTLSNFQSLTKLITLIINRFYSHCRGDWQIALTKQNFSDSHYPSPVPPNLERRINLYTLLLK